MLRAFLFGPRSVPPLSRWRRWLPPLALCLYLAILVIGNIRGLGEQLFPDTSDKLLHATAYGGLAALLFIGLRWPAWPRALAIIGLIAVLGALDEFIQSFMPHRHADVADWVADVAGAIAVCSVLALFRICSPRRLRRWWRGEASEGRSRLGH